MSELDPTRPQRLLTPDNFPTPRMALRNGLTLEHVAWFSEAQADAANIAARNLDIALASTPETQWAEVFADVYDQLVEWRYQLALTQSTASSGGSNPERFRTPITDETPNIDPVGSSVGFWHKGYEWNEALGRYAGGEETPASRLVAEVGEWVTARFDEEGNPGGILQNRVRLPDGRQINGTSILRKEAAHEQNRIGIERAKASGVDTSRFDVRGDFIYVKTATEADRAIIERALYDYLAQLESVHRRGEPISERSWRNATYLRYQSPKIKKGSDAVGRVYLMTLASRWFQQPLPPLADAVDWKAYVESQSRFVDGIAV
ncbi:MAG TPA: hypothetical protein VIM53_00205 [Candidatus Saccharimonadales bacterium]